MASAVLTAVLSLGLAVAPAAAQDSGESDKKAKLESLKKAYNEGRKAFKGGDKMATYKHFERAVELARELEQQGAVQQIESRLQKLPKMWGNEALKAKSYPEALTHFKKGIEFAPNQAYMHYGKGIALVNLDSTETAMKTLQKAAQVGEENGDTRTARLARERIREEYIAKASKALSGQNTTASAAREAVSHLDQMEEYVEPNAKAHFYRAAALYAMNEFNQAVQVAQQGLDMFSGSKTDRAKYHFVIGESYFQLDQKAQAKAHFQQAVYGDYKARAQHYLENDLEDVAVSSR
jgi:tetratricopeptide (TPR) repeat protein